VVGRVPLPVRPNPENLRYLRTKRDRMGHDMLHIDEHDVRLAGSVEPSAARLARTVEPSTARPVSRVEPLAPGPVSWVEPSAARPASRVEPLAPRPASRVEPSTQHDDDGSAGVGA
jgi:hypothetical protein